MTTIMAGCTPWGVVLGSDSWSGYKNKETGKFTVTQDDKTKLYPITDRIVLAHSGTFAYPDRMGHYWWCLEEEISELKRMAASGKSISDMADYLNNQLYEVVREHKSLTEDKTTSPVYSFVIAGYDVGQIWPTMAYHIELNGESKQARLGLKPNSETFMPGLFVSGQDFLNRFFTNEKFDLSNIFLFGSTLTPNRPPGSAKP